MNNEQLLEKVKKIKTNLEDVKEQLRYAQDILNQSITFNNDGFKNSNISYLNSKLNTQLNNLNNKIIPKIENM